MSLMMDPGWSFKELGRLLLVVGLLIAAAGAVLLVAARFDVIGRLPGDLTFHRGRWTFFLPLGTMIVLSIVLTVLLNLFIRR